MKKRKYLILIVSAFTAVGLMTGCGNREAVAKTETQAGTENSESMAGDTVDESKERPTSLITPSTEIEQLEDGFSAVRYDGDYWFDNFLEQGGASSDSEVIAFLTEQMQLGASSIGFGTNVFGCSTLAVKSSEGSTLFGRNFDWEKSEALVVKAKPSDGAESPPHIRSGERYASVSTVNMDFIRTGYGAGLEELPDEIRTMIALYAPLDGMNEQGLAVSVNMIQDSAVINQNTEKPDITTTTAIRLLLDRAANVEEALTLLEQYDMHSSMGMMVHFALTDRSGRSVVVEYVGAEGEASAKSDNMVVTETPVVTNFYLAPGEKHGIGSSQSHERYERLIERISEQETMNMSEVRDALDSVSKDNFGEFESTEWSIVFNLESGEARYYHREDYENSYTFQVNQ